MRKDMSPESRSEFERLVELTARVGSDPLLTQASTGNISIKVDGEMWIKASGRWMGTALRDNIFIPLHLRGVNRCLRAGTNPAERFAGASIETAMHAAMPQRVVLHAHCVNAIAWAVRADGFSQLQLRLQGLRWQWLPYLPSGLPLARGIEEALKRSPHTDLFVLANHGLLMAAEDVPGLENLLAEVRRRLNISRRFAHPADYTLLAEISADSQWQLPDNDEIHALGTDPTSRKIVSEGILFPCQMIFSGGRGLQAFQPVSYGWQLDLHDGNPPFLIIAKCGVLVSTDIGPAGLAMLSGLANVVQRLSPSAPIRYLTEAEIAGLSPRAVRSYYGLANGGCVRSEKSGQSSDASDSNIGDLHSRSH
jgi:rhamnose utilization protein RhaD (predicted bifunctional aldolase and dehydrogenase)